MNIEGVTLRNADYAARIYLQSFNQAWESTARDEKDWMFSMDYVLMHMPELYLINHETYVGMLRLSRGEISSLYICPDFRRKGYASASIQLLQEMYNELRLIVLSSNVIAINMYKKLGFEFREENSLIMVGEWKK